MTIPRTRSRIDSQGFDATTPVRGAGEIVKPDLLSDEAFWLTSPATMPLPRKAPVRFSIRSLGASRVGRAVAGIAVTGAILGMLLGNPGAMTDGPGAPIAMVATTPQGTEIQTVRDALASVVRIVAPEGISRERTFRSLRSVSFSVALDDGIQPSPDGTGLVAPPGARLQVSLTRHGFTVAGTPAAEWQVDWSPDPTVRSVHYDFSRGEFTANASGPGKDDWYRSAVADATNRNLRPYLPPAMRVPGYDPWTDPNLEANLQRVVDLFNVGPATSGTSLSAPSFGLSFVIDEDRRIALPDGKAYAYVDAGTSVTVSGSTTGPISDPEIESVRIRFSRPIQIMEGEQRDAVLRRIDLDGITIGHGAEVSLDYRIGAEETIDGLKALGMLFLIAAEPQLLAQNPSIERTRMDGARAQIQARIDGRLEPRLIQLLRDNDQLVPGFSLTRAFGID